MTKLNTVTSLFLCEGTRGSRGYQLDLGKTYGRNTIYHTQIRHEIVSVKLIAIFLFESEDLTGRSIAYEAFSLFMAIGEI
jgi:hypothetical protein